MFFDGGSKASLYCALRNRWKNVRTVLVSQNDLKNTVTRAGSVHKQLASIKSVSLLWEVDGARGPLWRGARLEEIGQTGLKPALTAEYNLFQEKKKLSRN